MSLHTRTSPGGIQHSTSVLGPKFRSPARWFPHKIGASGRQATMTFACSFSVLQQQFAHPIPITQDVCLTNKFFDAALPLPGQPVCMSQSRSLCTCRVWHLSVKGKWIVAPRFMGSIPFKPLRRQHSTSMSTKVTEH